MISSRRASTAGTSRSPVTASVTPGMRRTSASSSPGRSSALEGRGDRMWVRFVLVPGLTDGLDNVAGVADYVASLQEISPGCVERVEVLPFHQMGREEVARPRRGVPARAHEPPTPELINQETRTQFAERGLTTY